MVISRLSKKYRFPTFERHFRWGYCGECGRKALDTGYCRVDTAKYIRELGRQFEDKNE